MYFSVFLCSMVPNMANLVLKQHSGFNSVLRRHIQVLVLSLIDSRAVLFALDNV